MDEMTEDEQQKKIDAKFRELVEKPREERLACIGPKFMVPLDHPAIPPPGPDLVRYIFERLGVKVSPKLDREHVAMAALDVIYRSALYNRQWFLQVAFKGQVRTIEFLPGGLWILPEAFEHFNSSRDTDDDHWCGYRMVGGPQTTAPVMIVGKHPGVEELHRKQNFIGPSSDSLHRALRELKVPQEARRSWYVTNAVKHNRIDPTSGTMQQSWLKNCAPLLYQEILLVRPRFIACMGTEAIKAVLGKGYTVSNMAGRVVELTLQVPPEGADSHAAFDDLSSYVEHKVQVVGIPHPAYVFRVPEAYDDLHARGWSSSSSCPTARGRPTSRPRSGTSPTTRRPTWTSSSTASSSGPRPSGTSWLTAICRSPGTLNGTAGTPAMPGPTCAWSSSPPATASAASPRRRRPSS